MKILLIERGKQPRTQEIENTLNAMQKVVDGYIEALFIGEKCAIILNEQGKITRGIKPNRKFFSNGILCDVFYGTFFLCGVNEEGEFTDISQENIEKYSDVFKNQDF